MSIYKRKSGRYAVRIDTEPEPFRLLAELRPRADGRRRTTTVGKFRTMQEAEAALERAQRAKDTRQLSIERGVRGRSNLGTFRTLKEAEAAERKALEARDRGVDVMPSTLTLKELLERFVADREGLGRAEKTVTEYRRLSRLYIEPHLGSLVIGKLRPVHVSEWIGELLRQGGAIVDNAKSGRALGPRTVHHCYALLNTALRWAVRMELAGRNVCDAVTPPTIPKSHAKSLEEAEIKRLLGVARGSRWENFITIALTIGARRAELLALDWDDVDLEAGSVTISKAMCQLTGREPFAKATKTGTARTVPLSRAAVAAFRRQGVLQSADRLAAYPGTYRAGSAVFTAPDGTRLSPQAATSAYHKLAVKAGISTTRLHDTRHTVGTHLLASGVDVKTTSAVLGHAAASTTLNLYAHVLEGGKRDAVDQLGERMSRLLDAKG